jgi:hypothetical protein
MKTLLSTMFALPFVAAGLAACGGPQEAAKKDGSPEWRLEGTRLIACCCNAPCSCRINKPPTQAHGCEYTTAVHVERGHIGATKMDGVNWYQVGLGFAEDKKANWVVVYVDTKATDEQFNALKSWIEGGVGELGEKKLPYLAGAFVGFKRAPITWTVVKKGDEYHTSIPKVLDLKVKAIRNPGHPEPVQSVGVLDDFGNSFVHCEATAHTYKDGEIKYDGWDLAGKQANYADFVIGSGLQSPYKLGWGCWSAHKDFGTKDDYQERKAGHPKK